MNTALDSTSKPLKLPRSIPFPGARVPVRLVTDAKMIEVAGELVDGLWQSANQTIYLRKAMSPEDREEALYHEMHHAVTDMEWAARVRRGQGLLERVKEVEACSSTSPVLMPKET